MVGKWPTWHLGKCSGDCDISQGWQYCPPQRSQPPSSVLFTCLTPHLPTSWEPFQGQQGHSHPLFPVPVRVGVQEVFAECRTELCWESRSVTSGQTHRCWPVKVSSAHISQGPTGKRLLCKDSEPQFCPFWRRYLQNGPQYLLSLLIAAAGGRPQAAIPRSRPASGMAH